MQEEHWAQCLAHAQGWVVFSCIIISSGLSFIFFVNLLILRVLQVLNVIDHHFQLLQRQTPLGPGEHPALNAVRAAQVLLSSQGLPPSYISPGPSIQASPKALYPVLQSHHHFLPSQLPFLAQLLPAPGCIIPPEAASRPLLHLEEASFQALKGLSHSILKALVSG